MGKVLIKCIQTPMQKYFYDRSLDSVVMVNDEEYQILKTVEKTKLVPDGVLRRFVKSGLLRETAIEEIEHPETENLHLLAEHYMGNLILQVTQQCNLRCKYCAYSGNYYNRSHTSNRMDFETAKKAIDFYLKRSEKADQLALSFYGGEPLLEFELIKKCVSYILQRKGDKKILFTMTTNFCRCIFLSCALTSLNAALINNSLYSTSKSCDRCIEYAANCSKENFS